LHIAYRAQHSATLTQPHSHHSHTHPPFRSCSRVLTLRTAPSTQPLAHSHPPCTPLLEQHPTAVLVLARRQQYRPPPTRGTRRYHLCAAFTHVPGTRTSPLSTVPAQSPRATLHHLSARSAVVTLHSTAHASATPVPTTVTNVPSTRAPPVSTAPAQSPRATLHLLSARSATDTAQHCLTPVLRVCPQPSPTCQAQGHRQCQPCLHNRHAPHCTTSVRAQP